jgi:DNA-binding NtrC family response regulator
MMTPGEPKPVILVVDDVKETREILQRNLTSQDYRVLTAPGVSKAISMLESTPIDLVITDYKMPRTSGMDLVRHINGNFKDIAVIMITGFASVESAVEAIKSGAEEYLSKPFTDQELFQTVRMTLEKRARRRPAGPTGKIPEPLFHGLLGESEAMIATARFVRKAAGTDATVLISGESGTGKELIARAIHYTGERAPAPFVPVNCGGIPEGLIESELFGHTRGAFTGATGSRAGFFLTADGGTIFLDEISELGLSLQVKLLRVLQDKQVFMVGAEQPRTVDVRIVAATNKDLPSLVNRGEFREDLFYRLNVLTLEVPPLRERGKDILLLANHFVAKYARETGKPVPVLSDEVLESLEKYHWPGNVRELENVIQRLVVMVDRDTIDVPDLPSVMRFSAPRRPGGRQTLAEVEAEHIRNVLAGVGGNKTRAAGILGIDRKTLREKLKQMNGS